MKRALGVGEAGESPGAAAEAASALRGLAAAVRFLTAVPLPRGRAATAAAGESEPVAAPGDEPTHDDVTAPDLRWAAAFFPAVGLLVGVPAALLLALPLPPSVAAGLALLAWVAVTRGLHEDAWMDVMDAAFAPVARQRRLEILEDPRVGAHGVTGGGALLLLRYGALVAASPGAVLVAPVVGRWAMALSLAWAATARTGGLASRFAAHPRPGTASLVGASVAVALGSSLGWGPVAWAVGAGALVALPWGWFLAGRFGGLNGDGHGAVGHAAEVAALVAFVVAGAGGGG